MISRSVHRFGEPVDGGPATLEVMLMHPERDAGQLAVGIGWEVHGRDGMAWLDLGPWKLNVSWLLPRSKR